MTYIKWLTILLGLSVSLSLILTVCHHHEDLSFVKDIRSSIPTLASLSLAVSNPNVNLTRDICVHDLAFAPKTFQGKGNETRHIAFLKVHKCASTTLFNIFYRFGQKRAQTFVVPRSGHVIGASTSMRKRQIYPPSGNNTFDIACLHAVFEKEVYEAYLPSDAVYIAIIREPVQRLTSAFWYYRRSYATNYLSKIPGPNALHNFLIEPGKFEKKDVYSSVTNNRMTVDFGYPPDEFHNITHFKEYIKVLDARFQLVLDTKLFPESIILMKRMLNWTLKDVIYMSQNKRKRRPSFLTQEQQTAARNFLNLDIMLYEHFIARLKATIRNQDNGFVEEVENLKHVQRNVRYFCSRIGYYDMGKRLVVGESKWNKGFEVDFCDCSHMMLKEIPAVEMLRTVMRQKLDMHGPNRKFFLSRPK